MGRRFVAAVLVVAFAGACGNDKDEVAVPKLVPEGMVPAAAQDNRLSFYESELPAAREAFAEAGPKSLASDGRLWELRIGDRLIGVLQLTTLMPEVDITNADHRDPIVRQLLPTSRDRIDIGDITVWSATRAGKTTYLWFGDGMFALLTVKPSPDDQIEPEPLLQEVLDHMVAADGWKYVYFDDEDDGGDGGEEEA